LLKSRFGTLGTFFGILPGTLAYYCVHKPNIGFFSETWSSLPLGRTGKLIIIMTIIKTNVEILTKFQQYNC
jgi:hypothetical protein